MTAPIQSPHPHPENRSTATRQRSNRAPDLIGCRSCDHRWTGFQTCHCSGCHETFTGISAFDAHRAGGQCNNPAAKGLARVQKLYWCGWGWPGDDARWDT